MLDIPIYIYMNEGRKNLLKKLENTRRRKERKLIRFVFLLFLCVFYVNSNTKNNSVELKVQSSVCE